MKKTIICLFILLCVIGYGYCGENITIYDDTQNILDEDSTKIVVALEDGHLNTSFSNNYTGYCVEYTEQEAQVGDKFQEQPTHHIQDNKTGKDVSQYLKRYFIDHYQETQKDKIVTQHMIWHFTDNFDGWRINKTIIQQIRESNKTYDDDGRTKWNSTHDMVYSFRALISPYEHHQNYFIYNILFVPIEENETVAIIENNTENNITDTTNDFFIVDEKKIPKSLNTKKDNSVKIQIKKTGNPTTTLIGVIILTIITTIAITYKP